MIFAGFRRGSLALVALACATAVPTRARAAPARPPAMRLIETRGDVGIKRSSSRTDMFEPLTGPGELLRRDEIMTREGGADLLLGNNMVLSLGEQTLAAVIGAEVGVDLFLARGTLRVRPREGGGPRSVQLVTPGGRMTLRARDARVWVEGRSATVMVYEGGVNLWGRGGVLIKGGHSSRVTKGGVPQPPRPLLAAPAWQVSDGLYLLGQQPAQVPLRWLPVAGAARYLLEVDQRGQERPRFQREVFFEGGSAHAELRDLPVGVYHLHLSAVDEAGVIGAPSPPLLVVIAGAEGLSAPGTVTLKQGEPLRIIPPKGVALSIKEAGRPIGDAPLKVGRHQIQLGAAGVIADVWVEVSDGPAAPHERAQGAPAARPPLPVMEGPARAQRSPSPGAETPPPPQASYSIARAREDGPEGSHDWAGVEDVLLDGPSEVPGKGVRSPFAGRIVQLRLESSAGGAARLMLHGRLTLRNGFGGELAFSALRLSLSDGPAPGYGNLSVTVRSPSLRRSSFGLQGVLTGTFPIGRSTLDSRLSEGGVEIQLPDGGGWRIEAAVLVGATFGRLTLVSQNGVSIRLTSGLTPAYEGGFMVQAQALRSLRLLMLCQWNVGFLGMSPGQPGGGGRDAGGAVGAGIEGLVPAGRLGGLRLALLGRAGIGEAGAAVYGRGMFALQIGYRFR